jgi:hypothetical protein
MSFTAPLWNELVFEKINELHASHQEVMKHLSQLSIRIIHLENRMANISNGVGHLFAHFQNHKSQTVSDSSTLPMIPVTPLPVSTTQQEPVVSTITVPKHVSIEKESNPIEEDDERYSNEPDESDEGEWTKVSRKRK